MRTHVLLLCVLLGSCALVSRESAATATDYIRATSSPAAAQEADRPIGLFLGSFALGKMKHQTHGAAPNLDDSTDAQMYRLQVEAAGAVGGGANLEVVRTDDDLHTTAPTGADIEQVDFFGHLTIRTANADRFRCPVRVGPFFNITDLRGGSQSLLRTATFGLRIGVEPEFDVVLNDRFRLSLFGNVNFSGGGSSIDSDVIITEYDSTATALGVDCGVRASMPGFTASVAYVLRALNVDESDVSGGTFAKEADYDFNGIQFSLGVRW